MAALDLTNLPRFLEHLAPRDPVASRFARHLLDAGWPVHDFWGPEQMDVWRLTLQRGDVFVQFGVERGFSDSIRVARSAGEPPRLDYYRPIGIAVFVWARATGVPFRLDVPDDLDCDVDAHGRAALDWLADGHGEAFEKAAAAWVAYRHAMYGQSEAALRTLEADTVATMEAAAAG